MTEIDLQNLDRRVAERLIKRGVLTREQWDQHLAELPDLLEQAEPVATRFESGVTDVEPAGR